MNKDEVGNSPVQRFGSFWEKIAMPDYVYVFMNTILTRVD